MNDDAVEVLREVAKSIEDQRVLVEEMVVCLRSIRSAANWDAIPKGSEWDKQMRKAGGILKKIHRD